MKQIVVAVDGSEPARRALQMAVEMAAKFGAQLLAVNVFQPPFVPPEPYTAVDGGLEQSLRKYGEDVARSAAEYAKANGAQASWAALTGGPAEVVTDVAVAKRADLVVVGSRGQGAVRRAFLGSVSIRLAHICPVPLLIVH